MDLNIVSVRITTPEKQWTFKDVLSLTAPGKNGSFQVLFNHAPLLNQIEIGAVKILTNKGEFLYATSGGFLEVLDNEISLILETCEEASKIDIERAKQSEDRARKRLKDKSNNLDMDRAEIALAKALNRIRIATKV
jgi:F-type H+-transporting ATPase subunit epsilon